jgi:hypothetical protein
MSLAQSEYRRFRSSEKLRPRELLSLIDEIPFVPQATIAEDIDEVARRSHSSLVSGYDDLDEFRGVGFMLADLPFAIMHHRGEPAHTSTLYLPFQMADAKDISTAVRRVLKVLRIPPTKLSWQRGAE